MPTTASRPTRRAKVAQVFAEQPALGVGAVPARRGRRAGSLDRHGPAAADRCAAFWRPRRHVIRFRSYHWQPTTGNAYAASALREDPAVARGPLPHRGGCVRRRADPVLRTDAGPRRRARRVPGARREQLPRCDAGRGVLPEEDRPHREGHALVVARAPELGWPDVPSSADTALDAAFMGFRLASLRLDPANHPAGTTAAWPRPPRRLRALANRHSARLRPGPPGRRGSWRWRWRRRSGPAADREVDPDVR